MLSDLVISKESFPSKALMEFLALVRLFCSVPSFSSFCAIAACRYRTFSEKRASIRWQSGGFAVTVRGVTAVDARSSKFLAPCID